MRIAIIVALTFLIASGWAAGQNPPSSAGETHDSLAPSQAVSKAGASAAYIIGPGDILHISVWQEPQFSETVEVRPDGKISLPLVSDVVVAGLTPEGTANKLTDKLQDFVKHPLVSVVVAKVHSKIVYVIGQVEHPGSYPMGGPINISQLIASAGGVTRHAQTKHVFLLRAGVREKFTINYKKVLQGKDLKQNVQLAPGDTVVVP